VRGSSLYWFGEAIEEDVNAALVPSIPSSSDQEDLEVSNVFIDPVLDHVKVLEVSIGIFFCCCVLVCLPEVCSEVVPECFIIGKVGSWDSLSWVFYYCQSKLIYLLFDPVIYLFPSDE
jgi:hypothetical protein